MIQTVERAEVRSHGRRPLAKRLEVASWGAFFLWVGFALLANVPIGVGFLGVGVVALLAQAVRKALALPAEGFWIFVGLAFLVAGAWRMSALEIPLAPILLIMLGALLLGAALLRRR